MSRKFLKKNLHFSIVEGSCWAFMFGMGENYLSALSVFLGYSAFQISLLTSIPQFLGSLFQLFSNHFLKVFKSQRNFVVILSYIQAFLWLLLVYIIFYKNNYLFILLWFISYFTIAYIINPVWISWMGYIVPKRIRSTYHGIRNRNINFFILIAILLGGAILDIFSSNLLSGFSILFFIAFIGRVLSSYFISRKSQVIIAENGTESQFRYFLKNKVTFTFILFKFLINFSIMFLGALFAIYILRTLGMNNLVIGYCGASWWSGNILSSKYWGELSKKSGYFYILKITTISLSVLPFLWILVYYSGNLKLYIILILSLIAGITFSGFSLSSFNLVYDIVDSKDVVKFSSVLRFSEGLGILFSSMIAGLIADSLYIKNILSDINFTSVQVSILVSMFLRIMCLIFLYKNEKYFNT